MSGKVPPSSRAKSRPPISLRKDVQRAARLYEKFTGHEAEAVGRVNIPPIPKTMVSVGEVDGVLYTTIRDGKVEKYIHKFAAKDKPLLCVSPDGKSIYFVGGRYTFTERGIVDMSDRKSR